MRACGRGGTFRAWHTTLHRIVHCGSPFLDIIDSRCFGVWKPPVQCVVASLVIGLRVNQSCTAPDRHSSTGRLCCAMLDRSPLL